MLDPTGCEVHLWHSFTHEKEAVLLNLVAKFEAGNPYDIRVRVEFHSPLHREVQAAIAAGSPPDIVVAQCEQITEYALNEAVVPLSEYIGSAKHGLSQAEQADLWPVALDTACLPAGTKQPLGLFFDCQIAVMFYNVERLKKLKSDAPPQTWEEFKKMCSAARDKKAGTWGYAYIADGPTLVNWIAGLGGVLIDPQKGQAQLDSPEAIASVSMLKDLLQEGCAYPVSEPGTDRADFAAEKVLFTFGSTDDLPEYVEAIASTKTKKPRFKWDVAPMPHLTSEPVVSAQGSIMSMLRTTPRQQLAAWLFLKWFLQPENDVQWALATGALPVHKSSKDASEMQDYLKQNPQYGTACQLLGYARPEPAVPRWQGVRVLLVDAAAKVCLGQANPVDALAAADTAADSLLTR